MVSPIHNLKGKVKGRVIEFDRDLGLPDGEDVFVTIELNADAEGEAASSRQWGDGIRASTGAWAEGGQELDEFLEETHRARHAPHRDQQE